MRTCVEVRRGNLGWRVVRVSAAGIPARPCSRRAVSQLGGPFEDGENGPGGWWFIIEPELHFGADVVVPDIAGWPGERMPVVPAVPYYTLAPDWLCEVLSPSTNAIDRRKKLPIYARAGVAHAWLVDPLQQTLEVLRLESYRSARSGCSS